jgi:hypothetical protein
MVFRATIVNGRIEAPEAAELPNGTELEVRPLRRRVKKAPKKAAPRKSASRKSKTRSKRQPKSFWESIAPVVGSVKGLPADASLNIDHYLYGAKKR